jgi:hypothetical protein
MKIEKLEVIAKNLTYIENRVEEEWDDNAYINSSIHTLLHDKVLWKTIHIIMRMFPPVKLVYKMVIQGYIKKMSELNNSKYEEEELEMSI